MLGGRLILDDHLEDLAEPAEGAFRINPTPFSPSQTGSAVYSPP